MLAKDLLIQFPSIINTVFVWDDFYILAEMETGNTKKTWIYKNWVEEIILLDKLIKFKTYTYMDILPWNFPSLIVWKEGWKYIIIHNNKLLWPYTKEIKNAELLSGWQLYVIQKQDDNTETIYLNNKIEISNVKDSDLVADDIDSKYIIMKYKIENMYFVLINWTIMHKTTNKILEIWFEEWDIPYYIEDNIWHSHLDYPNIYGLE